MVNELAFGRPQEADLVDRLRGIAPGLSRLSRFLPIRLSGTSFSPAVIEGEGRSMYGVGLAPIAVLPESQRQGIGKALIGAGIDRLRASGESFVIVLGHPGYYPQFGFVPASRFGIRCEYDGVLDEAFMIYGCWRKR
ncbi:MAG: N-acetyltransferase [Desulfobacterales bacterium]|nr:N-acetyltransferase [Desulfobacterales bacterium]